VVLGNRCFSFLDRFSTAELGLRADNPRVTGYNAVKSARFNDLSRVGLVCGAFAGEPQAEYDTARWTMPRDRRQKRDLHALDGNGMVLCNPRDKEAAHRAEMEGIATDDLSAVTCRKCLSLLNKLRQTEEMDLE
jgi:hypothetical protein